MVKNFISVIGGANIDITGQSLLELQARDSNIGRVKIGYGGVARNISENLTRLGINNILISAFSKDEFSKLILADCLEKNIDVSHSLKGLPDPSSTYLCINDNDGDMALAISHMDIHQSLDVTFLQKKINLINSSKFLVMDLNLPRPSIDYLLKNSKVPVFLDTVSLAKTESSLDLLYNIYGIKPNLMEAEVLAGMKIKTQEDLKAASKIIHKRNIENVFISLGKDGVFYSSKESFGHIESVKTNVVNTTGAGDSFLSGLIYGSFLGKNIIESVKLGLAASAITLKTEDSVSKDMNPENLNNVFDKNWR